MLAQSHLFIYFLTGCQVTKKKKTQDPCILFHSAAPNSALFYVLLCIWSSKRTSCLLRHCHVCVCVCMRARVCEMSPWFSSHFGMRQVGRVDVAAALESWCGLREPLLTCHHHFLCPVSDSTSLSKTSPTTETATLSPLHLCPSKSFHSKLIIYCSIFLWNEWMHWI